MTHYAVVNPASGQTESSYPTVADADVTQAIADAHAAYLGWSHSSTVAERAALIARVAELHVERREALADIIVREMGKPREQALGEVDFSAAIYQYYVDHASELLADEPLKLDGGEGDAIVRRSPMGVLLGIMPWNFPYYQVARFAGPNLLIGNTILLKHAPQCPESALAIAQIYADAGFPKGAYVNLFASNEQVSTIIADPRVRGVSLTGSERAGAVVAEQAGRHMKKVVLELGGSDPFILLSTDDIDAVVESAVAARLDNSGQSCNAAKRFIIMDRYYDEFLEKFTAAVTATVPSTAPDALVGPLSSLRAAELLQSQLDRAIEQGASVVQTGSRDGAFFPPAVLTNVKPGTDAYSQEFFGPVAQVHKVSSEDEAIDLANDTPFGLGSYVWTTDKAQAERVANRIEAGMVYINLVLADAPELPFGGVKNSGFGRELGRYGADEFVNKKLIRSAPWS
ncbi:MAG TPA: NAD-dependent succinate-semialdehyde dehydrogenase [Microbacteriaceae bacterium]|nr:NAD-dependent succinate-semialdehyde dehydrogenase [Microbacteriaceae bacterium]